MALDIISTINLDLKRPNTETVYAVQYDTAGRIKAQLTNDGEAWHVPSSAGGMVSFRKSDNIGGFYDTTELDEVAVSVDENDDSIIYIALDAQTTITATPLDHPVQMQINFYSSQGKRLSTFAFFLRVQASVLFDGDQDERPVASEWTFRILTGALGQTIKNQEEAIKWMEDNIRTQAGYVVDDTLKVEGAAGDAKKIGELFEEIVKISDSMPGYFPTTDTERVGNTKYYTRSGTAPNYVYTEFTGATFATGVTYYEYSPWNRIWIDPDDNDVVIPTMDDLDDLSRQLSDETSALTDITGCTSLTGWSEEHYYLITNGSTVDVNSPSYSASYSWRYVVVPCVPGDVFTVNGQGGGVQRLWCFTDALYNVLFASPQSLIATNLVITAPPSAAFLILNDRSGNKSYSGKTIPNELDEINADVTALDAKIDAVEDFTYTDTDLSFVQEKGYVDCTNGTRSSASENYARTPFIKVDHNAEYYYTGTIQKFAGVCGYSGPNVNYFVASILDRITENDKYTFVNYKLTIPDNVSYIIASTKVSDTAQIVIKKREITFTREFENWKNIEEALNRLVDETKTTKVVLVGDSITAGVGGTGYANDGEVIVPGLSYKRNTSGYCWANLFKDYIEDNYNATVLNNGCSGTDSSFLLTYIQTLIPTDTDVVIISYGTNDRKRVVENNRALRISTLTSNMNQIIEYCRNNDIAFIINTPPPSGVADETNVVEGAKRWIHLFDIANYISKICFNNNARVCNVYNAVSKYCRFTKIDWEHTCLSDTLHPNDSGYLIMFREIVNLIGLALPYDNIYNVE